jgi:poly-D-alanine transfer protein DltD
MKLSFKDMTEELNIFDISRQSFKYEEVRSTCLIEEIVEETINELSSDNRLGECLTAYGADAMLDSITARETDIEGTTDTSSSATEQVKQELKPLPDTLKYKYLDPSESLLVIISSDLNEA